MMRNMCEKENRRRSIRSVRKNRNHDKNPIENIKSQKIRKVNIKESELNI